LEDILGTEPEVSNERNVQKLLREWHNEMGAPELLRFPRELVEKFVKDLASRVSRISFLLDKRGHKTDYFVFRKLGQKAIVRAAQTERGRDEAFYTTAAILATENMRAAHVLKMYTRERIYKVSWFRKLTELP
jgi:GINS complex subunit 4